MITGVLILLNVERVTFSFKDVEIGVGGAVQVLAAAGVSVLLFGLEVGADIHLQHKHGHERAFGILDEKVFEIQFTRVKLKSRKGESLRDGLHLGSKPRWEPQWVFRSAAPAKSDDNDEDDGEYGSEEEPEEPEALEASLSDDSDEEASVRGKKSLESTVWAQQTGAEAHTSLVES